MRPGQSAGIRGVFRKRFHYARFFRAFNWIRGSEKGSVRKGRKFTGHSLAGLSFETVSPTKMNFPAVEPSERTCLPEFFLAHARGFVGAVNRSLSRNCEPDVGNTERTTRKSSRHRTGAIAREVLSSFRDSQSCSKKLIYIPPIR